MPPGSASDEDPERGGFQRPTLRGWGWSRALPIRLEVVRALVEVAKVRLCRDDGAHGRDIEAEQGASHDGDGRNGIDIANHVHLGGEWQRVDSQLCFLGRAGDCLAASAKIQVTRSKRGGRSIAGEGCLGDYMRWVLGALRRASLHSTMARVVRPIPHVSDELWGKVDWDSAPGLGARTRSTRDTS
jgi:hypothetical protein